MVHNRGFKWSWTALKVSMSCHIWRTEPCIKILLIPMLLKYHFQHVGQLSALEVYRSLRYARSDGPTNQRTDKRTNYRMPTVHCARHNNGTHLHALTLSARSTVAPDESNSLTVSVWPLLAAFLRGVFPSCRRSRTKWHNLPFVSYTNIAKHYHPGMTSLIINEDT